MNTKEYLMLSKKYTNMKDMLDTLGDLHLEWLESHLQTLSPSLSLNFFTISAAQLNGEIKTKYIYTFDGA